MARLLPLLALSPLAACVAVIGEKETVELEGPIDSVVIDIESGDVTLLAGEGDGITVERWIAESVDGLATVSAEVVGGTLFVDARCADVLAWCSVDHRITVPAGVAAEVSLGSGDLTATGLAELSASSGSGDMRVREVAVVTVATGSGDVHVSDAADLFVETGSGDLIVDSDAQIVGIEAHTGSGDVDVAIPAGSYALSIDTGSGDVVTSGIDDAGGAPVVIDTGSGDVRVRGL